MNYYKNTPVKEWMRANIIDHYRGEKIITLQQRAKTLDTIKKDLQKVTADSEFDLTRRNKAQTILNNWSVAETLNLQRIAQLLVEDDSKGVDILVSLYIIRAYEMINSVFNKNWSSAFKMNKRQLNGNEISNKIGIICAKQQLRAIKNSAEQVDIFQKQFNEDTQKRSLENRDDHEVREKKKDSHDENFKALRKELSEKIRRTLHDELSEDIRESLREEFSEELRESIRNLRESLCKDLCYKLNE
ncbi:12839_t:CDS:2, partial [Funneliformis mosseae]